jgi:ATP-dependent DNA ligase
MNSSTMALQIHVRDGRMRLYTMNAADWTARYPRIVEQAARIRGSAIIDAEVVWLDADGIAQFDALHSRIMDHAVVACAFDLLMLDGDDLRRRPLSERLRQRRVFSIFDQKCYFESCIRQKNIDDEPNVRNVHLRTPATPKPNVYCARWPNVGVSWRSLP